MLLLHFFFSAAPRGRRVSASNPPALTVHSSTQVAREAEEVEQCTVSAGFLARDAQQDLDEATPAMEAAVQVRIRQHLFRIREHTSAYVGQELRMQVLTLCQLWRWRCRRVCPQTRRMLTYADVY